jgi:hypothetical protein
MVNASLLPRKRGADPHPLADLEVRRLHGAHEDAPAAAAETKYNI